MAENKTYTSLAMDRDEPLGNSEDAYLRRALHVKATNKITEPIPVTIVDGEPGTPAFWENETTNDPGNEKTILSGTFTAPTYASTLVVGCRIESIAKMKVNGSTVATLRTGAAQPNASFSWNPRRGFAIGDNFEVTIKTRAGGPISDCEAFFMALAQT